MGQLAAGRRARLRLLLSLGAALLLPGASAGETAARDATPPTPESVLGAAFANRYEVDVTSDIHLVMRDGGGGERKRVVRAASKMIDDRLHSIGRLEWPEYLRGMTILTIEATDRNHDAFVFLPELGRVRRISSAQRGDSFFGSDVTYEDIERRRVREYELDGMEAGQVDGEPVYVVRGRSRRDFSYDEVLFSVARSDGAIIEIRYFKRSQEKPYRVISSPRRHMVERDGHVLPTRMTVHNELRGTTTEIVFENLEVNPSIDDKLFSLSALEREQKLPGQE